MWYIGLDVHAETTVISIRSARGVVVRRTIVPTTAAELRRALKQVRGRVKITFEAGPLAPWLKGVLETQLREVIVCDRRRTRIGARGSSKSDKFDADRLSDCLRAGSIHPVYVPQDQTLELRRCVVHYVKMVNERRRVIQRLRSFFLESGVRLPSDGRAPHRMPVRRLPQGAAREIARVYAQQITAVTELVARARSQLLTSAARDPAFELLQSIPYVGEIRSATLLGIIGDPARFGGRRKLWSYGGVGVVQRTTADHRVEDGHIIREARTRGIRLSKTGQPLLKKVFADIALHASFGRGVFREIFDRESPAAVVHP
jgi:transposase